jgi:hypothetical protein
MPPAKQADPAKLRYQDRVELGETFVDVIMPVLVQGEIARLEFCVTRPGRATPPNPPTATLVPVARLVIPIRALVELHNQTTRLIDTLKERGVVAKANQPPRDAIN